MAELSTLGSVIKTAYEGEANTNAFTDAEKAKLGDLGGDVAWADVTGKPSTFPPSAHTHTIAQVTGLQAALDSKPTGTGITAVVAITQAAYDLLDPPVATTLYVIQD